MKERKEEPPTQDPPTRTYRYVSKYAVPTFFIHAVRWILDLLVYSCYLTDSIVVNPKHQLFHYFCVWIIWIAQQDFVWHMCQVLLKHVVELVLVCTQRAHPFNLVPKAPNVPFLIAWQFIFRRGFHFPHH